MEARVSALTKALTESEESRHGLRMHYLSIGEKLQILSERSNLHATRGGNDDLLLQQKLRDAEQENRKARDIVDSFKAPPRKLGAESGGRRSPGKTREKRAQLHRKQLVPWSTQKQNTKKADRTVASWKSIDANRMENKVTYENADGASAYDDDGDCPRSHNDDAVQNLLALNFTLRQSLEREEDARSCAVCAKEKVEERLANEIRRVQSLTDSLVKSESNARTLKAMLEEHCAKERRETALRDQEIAACKTQIQNLELTVAQLGAAKDAEVLHRWRSEDSADVARNDTIVLQREVNMQKQRIKWLQADRMGRRDVALKAKALARDTRGEIIQLRREVYDAQNVVTEICARIMRAIMSSQSEAPVHAPVKKARTTELFVNADTALRDSPPRKAPIRQSCEEFLPGDTRAPAWDGAREANLLRGAGSGVAKALIQPSTSSLCVGRSRSVGELLC